MKRFATLKPLTVKSRADVEESLKAMAALLAKSKERGRIHLRFAGAEAVDGASFTIELGGKSPKVSAKASGKPKVEIVTRAETWSSISQGILSPLEAFVTGKLRLRGDAEMAKRLVRELAADDGEIDICN